MLPHRHRQSWAASRGASEEAGAAMGEIGFRVVEELKLKLVFNFDWDVTGAIGRPQRRHEPWGASRFATRPSP
jgi:hypothetical protein